MAAASLPTLSSQGDSENRDDFKKTFTTSFHQTMFLVMPISMILFILRVPTVRLVYGVSNFPWDATVETAKALAFFSISIFAQSANYLLTRAFYSLKNTLTPVIVSVCTAIINIGLSILLVNHYHLGVWAVALAFSTSSILDMIVLMFLLSKKIGSFEKRHMIIPFIKTSISTILMGVTLYVPMKLLDNYVLDTTRTLNLLVLTLVASICGLGTYLLFTKIFKVEEINLLYRLIGKLKFNKKVIKPETLTYTE
jgi:putative peptidoglycan lipid II flippase